MARLTDIVAHCDSRLDAAAFDDYCPNGLQVEGREVVNKIVSGVTASQALVDAAIAADADLLLVHHGYFWRGEPAPLVGIKGRRVAALMRAGVSLLAYHLPLDAHPELGNNRQLAARLGFDGATAVDGLLWGADLDEDTTPAALARRVAGALHREPMVLGDKPALRRIAWCTGAAQGMLENAARLGFDAFISGEVSEQTFHLARELGIVYLGAGHHATERFGVQSLGDELASHFALEHRFIDIDNPV